jgi:serine/threonine protein kinase
VWQYKTVLTLSDVPSHRCVNIIMSPVADCDLEDFMSSPTSKDKRSLLQTSIGCLATALNFLHLNRVRHKDIKPRASCCCSLVTLLLTIHENILVKGPRVLLTDFGISRDWTEAGRSTTTGATARTEKYCALEVAQFDNRNTAADVWSLGCVILELWTLLCGESLQGLESHMRNNGSRSINYYANVEAISSWCETMKARITAKDLEAPKEWLDWMSKSNQKERWTVGYLLDSIIFNEKNSTAYDQRYHFIGVCCIAEHQVLEQRVLPNLETPHASLPVGESVSLEVLSPPSKHSSGSALSREKDKKQTPTNEHPRNVKSAEESGRSLQTSSIWTLDEPTCNEYNDIFESITKDGNRYVTRKDALAVLKDAGLRGQELDYFCSFVGPSDQASFYFNEFAVIFHLLRCRKAGAPIPMRLPSELLNLLSETSSTGSSEATNGDSAPSVRESQSSTPARELGQLSKP